MSKETKEFKALSEDDFKRGLKAAIKSAIEPHKDELKECNDFTEYEPARNQIYDAMAEQIARAYKSGLTLVFIESIVTEAVKNELPLKKDAADPADDPEEMKRYWSLIQKDISRRVEAKLRESGDPRLEEAELQAKHYREQSYKLFDKLYPENMRVNP